MEQTLLDDVRQLVADVFGVGVDSVSADSSPKTISQWDSLQHLNLVMALEQRFGLMFSPGEIEWMRRVGQAAELVAVKLGRGDPSVAHP